MAIYSIDKLISEARRLAAEFRRTTGKPLPGVSGEIAEHDAARLLDLEICKDRPGGYDAIGRGRRAGKRIQIKARVIFDEDKAGQRVGQLKLEQDWDSVMLVIMDEDYQAVEIYEADRDEVRRRVRRLLEQELARPGSEEELERLASEDLGGRRDAAQFHADQIADADRGLGEERPYPQIDYGDGQSNENEQDNGDRNKDDIHHGVSSFWLFC